MSWIEVESKIKVHEKDLGRVRKKIKEIAFFVNKETKLDQYFSLRKVFYPRKAFRIRVERGNYTVNFKKWLKKYWEKGVVAKEEFEFKIRNKNSFLALMTDLGFKKWVRKVKISEIYRHKKYKKLSIELNRVRGLGYFIEIEYLADKSEIEKAKNLVLKTMKKLEIKREDIDNVGYTKMLMKKFKHL